MKRPLKNLLVYFILCLSRVRSASGFLVHQRPPTSRTTSLLPHAAAKAASPSVSSAQLLEFQEPQTNVTVVLVGAMHYNPASIRLAQESIQLLGNQNRLGSVLVESCDIRWNKTAELYNDKPYLKKLLQNEMRTACDIASSYGRPTVLGDQRINITSEALKSSLKQTAVDLITPPTGWKRFAEEVSESWKEAVPFGGKGYLNAFAFFDPRLLLVLPVSLVKYPLSFLVRDPLPTSLGLSLLVALSLSDDPLTTQALLNQEYPLSDYLLSLFFAGLETVVFARLLLKPLLAERNKILAKNILEQCKIYAAKEKKPWWLLGGGWSDSPQEDDPEIIYAPGSSPAQENETKGDKVVVAVLGMAHCNGIMKLLKEQRV